MLVQRRTITLRLLVAALAAGLIAAPSALAQGAIDGQGNFGHDDSRDGTASEITSGFGPRRGAGRPDRAALPGHVTSTFDVTVPPASQGSYASFTVDIRWQDPRLDLDMYIYRQYPTTARSIRRPSAARRRAAPRSRARRSSTGWRRSRSSPAPCTGSSSTTGAPGTPTPTRRPPIRATRRTAASARRCPTRTTSWAASSSTASRRTTRSREPRSAGPTRGVTGQLLTFEATGTDDDGITNYSFDLDGDGRFEVDAGRSSSVTKRFDTPGTYNIGVRVIDGRNGVGLRQPQVDRHRRRRWTRAASR